MRSIQSRILLGLAMLFSIATLVLLSWTWTTTNHEVEELYDASLVQFARQFSSQLLVADYDSALSALELSALRAEAAAPKLLGSEDDYEDDYSSQNPNDPGHHYEQHLGFQVWSGAGERLLSSPSDLDITAPERAGFETLSTHDSALRIYNLYLPEQELWVRATQPLSIRTEMASEVAEHVLLPLAIVITGLIIAIAFTISHYLQPLKRISQELDQRSSDDLSPLSSKQLPQELITPVQSLNRMFQRVAQTLQRERRFTNDAAHELRTPLAALRIHTENLSLAQSKVQPLQQGLNRMERVVTQLLMLARLEPRHSDQLDKQSLDVERLAADLIAELVPTALRYSVQIELHTQTQVHLLAEKTLLEILLRNLIENAVRYTHTGDTVSVTLQTDQEHYLIIVTDHGPGLTDDLKIQVLQRFFRENKANNEGAGLGFSIIDQIVNLHRGSFTLSDTPNTGGLTIRVKLPMIKECTFSKV